MKLTPGRERQKFAVEIFSIKLISLEKKDEDQFFNSIVVVVVVALLVNWIRAKLLG